MSEVLVNLVLLTALAAVISYYDVRYRRIPNPLVLATLISGLILNLAFGGLAGAGTSLGGCGLAFVLMFVLHVFGAMGAGDVKLFAAIGSVTGAHLVLPTFFMVMMIGLVLAVYSMVRANAVRATMIRVAQIFAGLLPGWTMPRFEIPKDQRHTIPYGVAITVGSMIATVAFRA
jgi:prepilin peptidase CpaA